MLQGQVSNQTNRHHKMAQPANNTTKLAAARDIIRILYHRKKSAASTGDKAVLKRSMDLIEEAMTSERSS